MITVPLAPLALLLACSYAVGAGILGAAAFLSWVAVPVARRLPEEQAALLTGRATGWLRLMAALVLVDSLLKLASSLLVSPEFTWFFLANWGAALLLPIAILALAGPRAWRAWMAVLCAVLYLAIGLMPEPGERLSLVLVCAMLTMGGLGLCLGGLPPLRRLLAAPWPASVAQAVGARHFALILPGLALLAASLALAWPHRELFLEDRAFPTMALTAQLAILALIAAAARGGLLLLAARPGHSAEWLPPLRVVVEVELILALLLAAVMIPLFLIPLPRHEAWLPEALTLFGDHISSLAGALILAMAALAGTHAAGGPEGTRYWPLLLLPLAGLMVWQIQGEMGLALAVLLTIAALSELARLVFGGPARLALAPALLGVPALMLLLISMRQGLIAWIVGLAILGLVARWLELRLSPSRAGRLAGILHAALLGAIGVLLILPHVR
ncbi:hypothetical protein [Roseococcus sp. YIM B11640]|uniref:hypothetical protein n=1 Tax=Roseococcus sp. YIM B11640 TaxID=3133973 RepID=UPI003C7C3671